MPQGQTEGFIWDASAGMYLGCLPRDVFRMPVQGCLWDAFAGMSLG